MSISEKTEDSKSDHQIESLKHIVYQQIRAEMTAILGSCRHLQLLQYGTLVLLLGYILNSVASTQIQSPSKNVVLWVLLTILAGLPTIATWIGGDWIKSVMRQGSYLLLAVELPEYHESGPSWAHWIIANRSQSNKVEGDQFPGKYTASSGLKTHYTHQLYLIAFSGLVAYIAIFSIVAEAHETLSFWLHSPLLIYLAGLYISLAGRLKADRVIETQIRKWNEYLEKREKYDNALAKGVATL